MSEQPLLIQPKRDFLATAGPWAETVSKAVAGVVIALYASGFLIVSLYHSKFGFIGTNPFRPRVLAAGAWFFFLTSIPVSIAIGFQSESWQRIGRNAAGVWIACYSLGFLLGYLLFDYTPLLSLSPVHLPWWLWVAFAAVWASLSTCRAGFIEPMDCAPVPHLPDGSNWVFEIKFDGYRAIAVKSDRGVNLFSRRHKSFNHQYPHLVKALAELPEGTVVDGEVVALDESGRPNFNLLQNSRSEAQHIHYFIFDLLICQDRDLIRLPLSERRSPREMLQRQKVRSILGIAVMQR